MKVALLRGLSHSEYLASTSHREVVEYRALNCIDPIFPWERIEAYIAQLTALIFNINKREDAKSTGHTDWIFDYAYGYRERRQAESTSEFFHSDPDEVIAAALDRI